MSHFAVIVSPSLEGSVDYPDPQVRGHPHLLPRTLSFLTGLSGGVVSPTGLTGQMATAGSTRLSPVRVFASLGSLVVV